MAMKTNNFLTFLKDDIYYVVNFEILILYLHHLFFL